MNQNFQKIVASTIVAAGMVSGCGGTVGEKLRPKDHTAVGAMSANGAAKTCAGAPKYAKPLVVDLEPDTRVDLEAAMKRGVVVVSYDCATIRVLPTCKLPEAVYEYSGVTKQEQVLQIKSADELGANLPLSQGKLSAELVSGRTIDLALVYVGQQATVANKVTKDQLAGGCDDATHYVQMATIGAFSMETGSVGKVGAVAEMFGRGAKGQSASERRAMTSNGSLDACRTSKSDSMDPPADCSAPLRVELIPIGGLEAAAETASKPGDKKGDKDEKKAAPVAQNPCPPGFAMTDGICTRDTNAAFVCEPKNESQCKEQCDKGNTESCYNYGVLLTKKVDRAQSIPYFRKVCDAGVAEGCASLGIELTPDEEDPDVVAKAKTSLGFLKKACEAGSGRGCDYAGDMLLDKDYKIIDIAGAVRAYDRGCNLGAAMPCWSLAQIYFKGELVPKNAKEGISLLTKACMGGGADECEELGKRIEKGAGEVAADTNAALRWSRRACDLDAGYCSMVADRVLRTGGADPAYAVLTRGCDANDEDACASLADMVENGTGTKADPVKAATLRQKACKDGDGNEAACKRIGVKMKD